MLMSPLGGREVSVFNWDKNPISLASVWEDEGRPPPERPCGLCCTQGAHPAGGERA